MSIKCGFKFSGLSICSYTSNSSWAGPDAKEVIWVVSPLLSSDWLVTDKAEPEVPAEKQIPKVLFVGRLSAEKNISALIDACALAKTGKHRFELTVVGDGPLDAELQQLVEQLVR